MSRHRAQGASVARLQALLPPAESGAPRVFPARPRQLRPLARIVAQVAGRATGSGPPNIFTTLGQHPRLFRAWLRYSAQLVPIALRVGLTPDEVAGIADSLPANVLSTRQRMLLAVSDELLARRALSDMTWSAAAVTLGNREAIELCMLIGNYQGLASTIGGLGIQIEPDLDPPS